MTLLTVDNLFVSHGDLVAVRDVSFTVEAGETFVLLGANGAGKTSILRAISGLLKSVTGTIASEGQPLMGLRPDQMARLGIAHVPEGRKIFSTLTVEENLDVSFIRQRAKGSLAQSRERVYALFPRLRERHRQVANTMSGGEQQMLAIGRAMMNTPSLLMLDEPSLGLSPLMTQLVFEQLVEIQKDGVSILLVEQNASCLEIATRGLLLGNGQTLLSGDYTKLRDSDFVRRAYLGL
jgi:branched-chain amino acid transport system ATP-binding protein